MNLESSGGTIIAVNRKQNQADMQMCSVSDTEPETEKTECNEGGKNMIWLLVNLALGGFAGWFAGKLMNVEASMLHNIILGLIGGVVGNIVLGIIGIHGNGPIGGTIVSIIGACLLIWGSRKLGK